MKDVLLALDFDGVIWDSVGECYHTALRTWRRLGHPEIEAPEATFRSGRWLVRTGGDFGLILEIASEDPDRDLTGFPKEEFARRAAAEAEVLEAFDRAFYEERDRARSENLDEWLHQQAPYPGFVAEIPALQEEFREIVLCSTKDEASIRELLSTVDLDFPVLGKGFGTDKRDQVRHLMASRDLPADRILFVDDLLPNLDPVSEVGVRIALAGWGYNTPAVREEARQRGIPVIRLGHVLEDLRRA